MRMLSDIIFKKIPSIWVILTLFVGMFFSLFYFDSFGEYYSPVALIAFAVVLEAGLICFCRYAMDKIGRMKAIRISIYALAILMMIFIGTNIQVYTNSDLIHLHTAAKKWVDTGSLGNPAYFSAYPYQLPYTILIAFVYKIESLVGIADYRIGGVIMNGLFLLGTMWFAAKMILRLWGEKIQTIFLVIFALSPILFLYVPYYYNDIPSMFMVVLILYLSTLSSKKAWAMIGVFAAIGMLLRATIVIAFIAAVLGLLLGDKEKKLNKFLLSAGSFVAVYILLSAAILMVPITLNPEEKFPFYYYFLVGLSGNGRYDDWLRLQLVSIPTYDGRCRAIRILIKEVIKERGFIGMISFWIDKQLSFLCDGNMTPGFFLYPVTDFNSFWSHMVGNKSAITQRIIQLTRFELLINAIIGMVVGIKKYAKEVFVLVLFVFGFSFFHYIWEIQPRYAMPILPILMVLAAIGVDATATALASIKNNKKACYGIMGTVYALCIILSIVTLISLGKRYVSNTVIQEYPVVYTSEESPEVYPISSDGVEQSITINRSFNQVTVGIDNNDSSHENQLYELQLLNSENHIVGEMSFTEDAIEDNLLTLNIDTYDVSSKEMMTVVVKAAEDYENPLNVRGYSNAKGIDYIPDGEASGTDGILNDLAMGVKRVVSNDNLCSAVFFAVIVIFAAAVIGIPSVFIIFSLIKAQKKTLKGVE